MKVKLHHRGGAPCCGVGEATARQCWCIVDRFEEKEIKTKHHNVLNGKQNIVCVCVCVWVYVGVCGCM